MEQNNFTSKDIRGMDDLVIKAQLQKGIENLRDKYFTPSIEDIRVGYECEIEDYSYIYSDGGPSQRVTVWKPFVVNEDYLARGYSESCFQGEQIRVPYLTKEQIEAEGWTHEWEEKGVHSWNKGELILSTFDGFHRIKINYKSGYQLFDGECKDINTFRYICKLLGI